MRVKLVGDWIPRLCWWILGLWGDRILPPTYYADRPFDWRLRKMVEAWRRRGEIAERAEKRVNDLEFEVKWCNQLSAHEKHLHRLCYDGLYEKYKKIARVFYTQPEGKYWE